MHGIVPIFSLYTAALVVELLEYCDEHEEEAGGSDTEMEEGERGKTSIA